MPVASVSCFLGFLLGRGFGAGARGGGGESSSLSSLSSTSSAATRRWPRRRGFSSERSSTKATRAPTSAARRSTPTAPSTTGSVSGEAAGAGGGASGDGGGEAVAADRNLSVRRRRRRWRRRRRRRERQRRRWRRRLVADGRHRRAVELVRAQRGERNELPRGRRRPGERGGHRRLQRRRLRRRRILRRGGLRGVLLEEGAADLQVLDLALGELLADAGVDRKMDGLEAPRKAEGSGCADPPCAASELGDRLQVHAADSLDATVAFSASTRKRPKSAIPGQHELDEDGIRHGVAVPARCPDTRCSWRATTSDSCCPANHHPRRHQPRLPAAAARTCPKAHGRRSTRCAAAEAR